MTVVQGRSVYVNASGEYVLKARHAGALATRGIAERERSAPTVYRDDAVKEVCVSCLPVIRRGA